MTAWPDFLEALDTVLSSIPPGMAATPGDIARALGDPLAARAVPAAARRLGRGNVVRRRDDDRPPLVGPTDLRTSPLLRELREEQTALAARVDLHAPPDLPTDRIYGTDAAYLEIDGREMGIGVLVEVSAEGVRRWHHVAEVRFPYVPTYLTYREAPLLAPLLTEHRPPGPVLVEGNGILHHRGIGLASHLGVITGTVTIGVAKSLLVGGPREGEGTWPVHVDGRHVGWGVRMGRRTMYVSPGHRMDLEGARDIAAEVLADQDPIRLAHRHAAEVKRTIRGAGDARPLGG